MRRRPSPVTEMSVSTTELHWVTFLAFFLYKQSNHYDTNKEGWNLDFNMFSRANLNGLPKNTLSETKIPNYIPWQNDWHSTRRSRSVVIITPTHSSHNTFRYFTACHSGDLGCPAFIFSLITMAFTFRIDLQIFCTVQFWKDLMRSRMYVLWMGLQYFSVDGSFARCFNKKQHWFGWSSEWNKPHVDDRWKEL